jgi:hypothetical protein
MDLLSTTKYQFFSKHVGTIGVSPLPRRNNNQSLRISMLHERAWLLKMLALALHVSDISSSLYRESCLAILCHTFGHCAENLRSANLLQSPGSSNLAMNGNKVMLNNFYLSIFFIWPFIGVPCSFICTGLCLYSFVLLSDFDQKSLREIHSQCIPSLREMCTCEESFFWGQGLQFLMLLEAFPIYSEHLDYGSTVLLFLMINNTPKCMSV